MKAYLIRDDGRSTPRLFRNIALFIDALQHLLKSLDLSLVITLVLMFFSTKAVLLYVGK